MNTKVFFNMLWTDYVQIAPQAEKVHNLFSQAGEEVINDHVAFRTFSNSNIDLLNLEPLILSMGYQHQDSYLFKEKKLNAISYQHPDKNTPRIFISELQRHELSRQSQDILERIVQQIPSDTTKSLNTFSEGTLWKPISFEDYQTLAEESEYAAWLASMGMRANHFTVSVNHLKHFSEMEDVIDLIESNGIQINKVGGAIKGTPDDFLIQASTIADVVNIKFSDNTYKPVPSCFYEFAKRYENTEGSLFDGFIANNADKIFESTNRV